MNTTIHCLLFIGMIVSLPSCIGGGVVRGKNTEYQRFTINITEDSLLRRVTNSKNSNSNPTKSQLTAFWGNPDKQSEIKGSEIWTYNTETAIRGVVPMVGIGIPLVTPAGKNGIDVYFKNHSLRSYKAVVRSDTWSGGYYGPEDGVNMESGFHKLRD